MKIGILFGLLLVLVNSAGWYWYTNVYMPGSEASVTAMAEPQPNVVSVFIFTLQDEVRKKIGQPIEGYEPQMFLQVFPGLAETDFEGVEASIGSYQIESGRLVHKIGEPKLIHSAATAITKKGMATLLTNVTKRTGINLDTDGTLTDVMSALTSQ